MTKKRYWWKAIASFLMVLCTMPLGHSFMILMEHCFSPTVLHYVGFALGAAGMLMVVTGVFAKGDTRQTLWGFFGGLLFWTGWVEYLFMYYANRFGTNPQLNPLTGEVVTRPEYLIMPTSFGFWMMVMMLYLFSTKNGCNFISWWQRVLFRGKKGIIAPRPMTRHVSIVTFMEFMMIIWSSYLLLMFCYDEHFLGERHPITLLVGLGCFIGAFFIFKKQLHLPGWGANIRMAIPTVIVFWTPIEIMGRNKFLKEIWIEPQHYIREMVIILAIFILLSGYLICQNLLRKKKAQKNIAA